MRKNGIESLVSDIYGLIESCGGRGVARYCNNTCDEFGNPLLVGSRKHGDIVLMPDCVRCGSVRSAPFSPRVRKVLAKMF